MAALLLGGCGDCRDAFAFARVAVPAFDPSAATAAKQHAALLAAAQEHLGSLLAELYVAMPSLAACGFKASLGKRSPATTLMQRVSTRAAGDARAKDAASVAVAAVAPSVGVDMQGLRSLVAKTREALAQFA